MNKYMTFLYVLLVFNNNFSFNFFETNIKTLSEYKLLKLYDQPVNMSIFSLF